MSSFLLMLGAFYATPFVAAYAAHWTGTGKIGLVVMTTAWMWTALYWGAMVHAKQVMRLFERLENATKN